MTADRLALVVSNIHLVQRVNILCVTRIDPHHHLVLIERLIDGRNLALTKGVVQQAVDIGNVNAQPRHAGTVIGQGHFGPFILLVRVHVHQFRQGCKSTADFRLPLAQVVEAVGQQRILITPSD